MRDSVFLPQRKWLRDTVLVAAFVAGVTATKQAFCQIETVTVQGRAFRESIDLQGATVRGFQVTEIRAKLGGYVKTIGTIEDQEVDVGSHVSKGSLLAVLDIPEMQNELAEKTALVAQAESAVIQAEAAIAEAESVVAQSRAALDQVRARTAEKEARLKLNQSKFRRLSKLAASGTIGKDNLDEAQYDVDVAQAVLQSVEADVRAATANITAAEAAVRKAHADKVSAQATVAVAQAAVDHVRTMMNYTVIKAPYDGVITKRLVDIGSFVQPAENNSAAMPLFQITQVSRVRIVVAVPNNSVGKIRTGQAIVFDSIGGLEGRAFSGTVTRSADALDPATRTMRIEIHMPNPAVDIVSGNKVELKPGLYGTLTVIRKDWKEDAPLPIVPTTAVGKDKDGNYFVVVVENGKPTRRVIQVAFNDASSAGVSAGLKVGEKVVRSGVSRY